MSGTNSYKSIVKLTRPQNVIFGSLTAPVGAYIAYTGTWDLTIVQILFAQTLAVGSFIIFGNVLNDIIDLENDKINHPLRPLPSGRVSLNYARNIVILSSIASMIFVAYGTYALTSLKGGSWVPVSLIWVFAFFLMLTYEIGPKTKNIALLGNTSISLMVGLVIIYGAASVGSIDNTLIWYVGSVAFFVNLAREIVKDVEDMDGDTGRRTLPMLISKRKSRIFSWFLCLISIILLAIPYYAEILPLPTIIFQIPSMLIILRLNITLNNGDDTKSQKNMKLGMYFGLLGFIMSVSSKGFFI